MPTFPLLLGAAIGPPAGSVMRIVRVVPVLLVLVGCGGAVVDPSLSPDGGKRRDGGRAGSGGDGGTNPPPREDAPPNDDFPVFREDACADVATAPPMIECDPFLQTCTLGMACYPIPPRATDNCRPGRYSTICLPAGRGTQGTPCGDGTDCAAGFICVKSGQGDQCVKLCRTDEFNSCTDGRVCREVDVTGSGLGGCE